MRSTYKPQRYNPSGSRSATPVLKPVQQVPLGDVRFQALLAQANAFFNSAERDMVAEKAAAIAEIQALMSEYQLSLDDIQDPV